MLTAPETARPGTTKALTEVYKSRNAGKTSVMKRVLIITASLVALLLPSAAGGTGGPVAGGFAAKVNDTAIVVTNFGTTATTNFEFDVYNCPAGQPIDIVWSAEQPRPGTSTSGDGNFLFSTGDPIQHFVVSTIGGFRPGYTWVGSGVVNCGALTAAVQGSGPTVPVGGASSPDDD
jgi:hypothetical protein